MCPPPPVHTPVLPNATLQIAMSVPRSRGNVGAALIDKTILGKTHGMFLHSYLGYGLMAGRSGVFGVGVPKVTQARPPPPLPTRAPCSLSRELHTHARPGTWQARSLPPGHTRLTPKSHARVFVRPALPRAMRGAVEANRCRLPVCRKARRHLLRELV